MRKYGWIPDVPDQRDVTYRAVNIRSLPVKVDLRAQCPPVFDQGTLGSCTANAICSAHMFSQKKSGKDVFMTPSRLFIYYNERFFEGTVRIDNGAQIRTGIKCIAKRGVCPESIWPYDIDRFKVRPKTQCFKEALKHQAIVYQRIDNGSIGALKSCLASGYPFVFGFSVYESFDSAEVTKDGLVRLPEKEERLLGGHAVVCVGYDDATERFSVLNSYGKDWGDEGYFTMPYAYLTNKYLSDDFWTIREVELGK